LARLSSVERHPLFCFPKCWNELPAQELKLISSKNAFNKLLKEHLLNSLDENFVSISFYNRFISISAPIGAYFLPVFDVLLIKYLCIKTGRNCIASGSH
jgi:hypothetical protein